MRKFLPVLAIPLFFSGPSFADGNTVDAYYKALGFPSGLVNHSNSNIRFSESTIKSWIKDALNVKSCSIASSPNRCYLKYANIFNQAGAEFGVEPALLAAIAMTETRMNESQPPNGADCKAASARFSTGISKKGCLGMMQFAPATFEDMSKTKALKGRITSLQDAMSARIAIPTASYLLGKATPSQKICNNKPIYSINAHGIPRGHNIHVIRQYNAGYCGEHNKLVSPTRVSHFVKTPKKSATYENYEYLYKTITYYVVFGGKNPGQFSPIFNGRDPYLLTAGINVGSGTSDFGIMSDIDTTTPYVRPTAQCKTDTRSPLAGDNPLPIVGTYGERYDSASGKMRFNRYTQFSASENAPIYAINKGTILGSEEDKNGLGQVLKIKNEDGSVWLYGTIKNVQVENGAVVEAGQQIALAAVDSKEQTPMLTLGYFKDATKSLALEETNENFDDPLAHYCGNVDIPSDFTTDTAALSEMVTDIKTEQANSMTGALESLINNRLGNAQWLADISVMSAPRLYAELAYMKAIRLQMKNLNQQIEDRTAVLKAAKIALLREQTLEQKARELQRMVTSEQ